MTRLTNDMRNLIASSVVAYRFDKPREDLSTRWIEFSNEVYNDIYDAKQRRLMASLPDGWLPMEDSFPISFGGFRDILSMNTKRAFPYSSARGTPVKIYAAEHPLSSKHMSLANARKDLQANRIKCKAQADGILNSVNTVARLLDVWPEIKSFIPGQTPKVLVPALRIAELNAALKLPPESAT
jgi:hypothetical protein